MPEPWLRGVLTDLDPVIGHLVRSCEHMREDLAAVLSSFERAGVPAAVQFHATHLAGSTNRLCAYLEGHALTETELAELAREDSSHQSAAELIEQADHALNRYEHLLRSLRPADFTGIRYVGRARLPVTAIGLAIHIAEHGQRHVGQAITEAKRA